MNIKFVKASDDEFTNFVCPFCKKQLTEIKTKSINFDRGNFLTNFWEGGKDYGIGFFCPECKSLH
jgi:hypothetical protein